MLLASGMTHAEVFKLCNDVCPISKAVDVRTRCDAHHTFHSLQYTFTEAQKYHPQMQWHILFISFMLLLGAIIRMTVPKWIPYTVFILIISCVVGLVSQKLSESVNCPYHAFLHDTDHDYKISRTEWSYFLCEGCNTTSYCMSTMHPLPEIVPTLREWKQYHEYPRTCGDGSYEQRGLNATAVGACAPPDPGPPSTWQQAAPVMMISVFVVIGSAPPPQPWWRRPWVFASVVGVAALAGAGVVVLRGQGAT